MQNWLTSRMWRSQYPVLMMCTCLYPISHVKLHFCTCSMALPPTSPAESSHSQLLSCQETQWALQSVRAHLPDCQFLLNCGCVSAVEAFADTDQRYLQADFGANRDDGCTAVTAILIGQNLIVANVGDSRAVLSKGGQGEHQLACKQIWVSVS